MVKILEISRFSSKFSKNSDYGHNFRKIPIFVRKIWKISIAITIYDYQDCDQNLRKISILVIIFKNLDFDQYFRKISILVRIYENFWF